MRILLLWLVLVLPVACVSVDPETGKTIPRGGQRYEFSTVERRAEKLRDGMTKYEALMMLGSPAKASDDGDVWTYLPERPAVLIPSRALRLVFEKGRLKKHGYRAIIFGQRL